MWTFRLRLHLKNGQQEDLFGTEAALVAYRHGLRRILERGGEEAVPYQSNGQAIVIEAASVEKIGDLEPVIPASFTFGTGSRQS